MTEILCLELQPSRDFAEQYVRWGFYSPEGEPLMPVRENALADIHGAIVDSSPHYQVIVLLPHKWLTLHEVTIQAKQSKQILQAVPFLIEELLLDDIEDLHICIGKIDKEKPVPIAALKHQDMVESLDWLYRSNLAPHCFYPASACHGFDDNQCELIVEGHGCVLHWYGKIYHAEPATLMPLIESLVSQTEIDADTHQLVVNLFPDISKQSLKVFLPNLKSLQQNSKIKLAQRDHQVPLFDQRAKVAVQSIGPGKPKVASHYLINCLQGGYKLKEHRAGVMNLWRPVAMLGAVWFACQLLFDLGATYFYRSHAIEYEQQSKALYRKMFPNDKRIVSLRSQFQKHLEALAQQDPEGFLWLLSQSGQSLSKASGLSIGSIKYQKRENILDLEVRAKDMGQLDQYKQALEKSGLRVEISSAVEEKDQVRSRLQVKKG